jgi:hypothetical protein
MPVRVNQCHELQQITFCRASFIKVEWLCIPSYYPNGKDGVWQRNEEWHNTVLYFVNICILNLRFCSFLIGSEALKFATSLNLAIFTQLNVSRKVYYSICQISRWLTALSDLTMNLLLLAVVHSGYVS